jgi:hypothetical protein
MSTSVELSTDFLCQHWVNSYEEEQETDKEQIYRPAGFKQFPDGWFRMQYVFSRDGDCKWFYLSPKDDHHFKPGKWKVDLNDRSVLQVIKGDITESYRVSDLKKDVLRISFVSRK